MKSTVIKTSILAGAIILLSGCASTEEMAQIRSIAESAQSAANSAQSTASNALGVANQALDAARAAQASADAAMACCNENTSRLDRMFEKAMQK